MQTPLAISASLLAVVLWVLTRRRPHGAQPSPSLVPGVAPIALTQGGGQVGAAAAAGQVGAMPQAGPIGQMVLPSNGYQRRRALLRAMDGGPDQRLAVMHQLGAQPDRAALPLLQRGLRDANPAVVQAAAMAMGAFRGRTAAATSASGPQSPQRLPRNGAPMGARRA